LGVRPLSESPQRSLGKSVHLNRPGKKQISGFGLLPIAVIKIELGKTNAKSPMTNITSTKIYRSVENLCPAFGKVHPFHRNVFLQQFHV